MKTVILTLSLLITTIAASSQCPPNLDFEMGNYSGWEFSSGFVKVESGTNQITLTPGAPQPGIHELVDVSSGIDRYGKFPVLCPYGGNYSIKLGNSQSGSRAEGMSYTFIVPSAVDTFTFTFFYAVVFEDPQHTIEEQPRFFATAYDVVTGDLINCASYNFVSTSGIPGFKVSTVDPGVLYKEWSPVSIQFAGMANRQVRLEFKTADCTQGGHFGYAYVDVGTECSNILATAPYCIETNSVVLNAPYGFGSYTWYNHDYSVVMGNGQSLTLSPPPQVDDIFFVDMIPYPGFGCRDTTYARVRPEPVPDTPVAKSIYNYCQFDRNAIVTARPLPGYELLWYTSETGGVPSSDTPIPSTNNYGTFTYYVSQKRLFGCESKRKLITVIVTRTPVTSFTVNSLSQCQDNNQFIFTNTSTNLDNSTYKWEYGDTQISSDLNATHDYINYGPYNVKLTVYNTPECFAEKTIQIKVVPKPVAAFNYPSTICERETQVALLDQSSVPTAISTVNGWWWSIDGSIVNVKNPVPFMVPDADTLNIKLAVTSTEGCKSDTINHKLVVRHKPVASYTYNKPLCDNRTMQFLDHSYIPQAQASEFLSDWRWQFDNGNTSPSQQPVQSFRAGVHQSQLIVQSNYGCKSIVADSTYTVNPKPQVDVHLNDSCIFVGIHHTGIDLTNSVAKWYWDFGRGSFPGASRFTNSYHAPGPASFTIIGETIKGCTDTLYRDFMIYDNKALAGNDTLVAIDQPVQLNAGGGPLVTYTWTPAIGLNNPGIENPVATYDKDQTYNLYAISDKGCVTKSDIYIKRFVGPDLHMPNAFTPNNDNLNDVFNVTPIGILKFNYLTIYNRRGQIMFHTTDPSRGWNGSYSGQPLQTEVFVVVASAIDYKGKPMLKKGTLTLIR